MHAGICYGALSLALTMAVGTSPVSAQNRCPIPKDAATVAEDPALHWQPTSAIDQAVATDLYAVLSSMTRLDTPLKGYSLGRPDAVLVSIYIDPAQLFESTKQRVLGRAAFIEIKGGSARDGNIAVYVCEAGKNSVTLSLVGMPSEQISYLLKSLPKFLRAQQIVAAGQTIWPNKEP